MAEQTLVRRGMWLPVPDGVDDVTAAAVANPGMAAWKTLLWEGELAAGQTVLVLGATGASGRIATQLARRHGARVVAAGEISLDIDPVPLAQGRAGLAGSRERPARRLRTLMAVNEPVQPAAHGGPARDRRWRGRLPPGTIRALGYAAAAWCLGFAGVSAWQVATDLIGRPAVPRRLAAYASGLAIMAVLAAVLKLAGAAMALAAVRVRPPGPRRSVRLLGVALWGAFGLLTLYSAGTCSSPWGPSVASWPRRRPGPPPVA